MCIIVKTILLKTIIILLAVPVFTEVHKRLCGTPHGYLGHCMSLKSCPLLRSISDNILRTTDEYTFLTQSMNICTQSRKIKVCCPQKYMLSYPVLFAKAQSKIISSPIEAATETTTTTTTARIATTSPKLNIRITSYNTCGRSPLHTKIIGGEATQIDEYPWLAILDYSDVGGVNDNAICGASLITNQHLLTAAHCLHSGSGDPKYVRLAEYNITSYPTDTVEVDGGETENLTVTIVPIEWYKPHPKYSETDYTNDIAIIKMKQKIEFTDYIQTVCLPTRDYMKEFTRNTNLTTAGWGRDGSVYSTSDVRRHVRLPYAHCLGDNERQICAGGEKGRDSCTGDSGGPLMYSDGDLTILVGVTSTGYSYVDCGTEGFPAVYTYVYSYIDWINDEIKHN